MRLFPKKYAQYIFFFGASLLIEVAEVALVLLGRELEGLKRVVVEVHAELYTLAINVLRVVGSVDIGGVLRAHPLVVVI
jgi:hypothetical protein